MRREAEVDAQTAASDPVSEPAEPTAARHIWLCADDYGIAPGVNRAIRDLILRGRLNATSVMVVAPSFSRSEALSLAILNTGAARTAIGLHLTLTAPFRPLSAGFRPARDGAFLPVSHLLRRAMLRRLSRSLLAAEIEAQLAAFSTAFGRASDFVDGHQHVQLFPQVRAEVLAAVKRRAPEAWVRQCGSALPLLARLRDRKGFVIDLFSRRFRSRARALDIAVNPAFAGTYDFSPNADFATLFPGFLARLPDGGVIMCHPGHVDDELMRLDPLTTLREHEYAYLAGDIFPAVLAANDVALI